MDRPLTIAIDNITIRTSLNAVCESAGLRWSLVESEPPALLFECQDSAETVPTEELKIVRADGKPVQGKDRIDFYQPAKPLADRLELVVSMKLEEAPLEKVLKMAAKLLNAKMVMDIKLCGEKVTLDLAIHVCFTGPLSEMPEVLNSLDLVVLPSLDERCSRVLLEAIACGKPVVATRVGGTPEIVSDGVNGILVPPKDPAALADALARLLTDDALRRALGMNGRHRAVEVFGMTSQVQRMRDLYLGVRT